VHFTEDTLILTPKGKDIFALGKASEENQYVFVNSMLSYKFVEFYAEYLGNVGKNTIRIIYYIDSARNSRIVVKNEYFDETTVYKTPISEKDYERLVKILSSCDIGSISEEPKEDAVIDKEECLDAILEIRYNDQIKTFKGCFDYLPVDFGVKLGNFLFEYFISTTGFYAPGWAHYLIRKF